MTTSSIVTTKTLKWRGPFSPAGPDFVCGLGQVSPLVSGQVTRLPAEQIARQALSSGPTIWGLFLLGNSALKKPVNMLANHGQKEPLSSSVLKWRWCLAGAEGRASGRFYITPSDSPHVPLLRVLAAASAAWQAESASVLLEVGPAGTTLAWLCGGGRCWVTPALSTRQRHRTASSARSRNRTLKLPPQCVQVPAQPKARLCGAWPLQASQAPPRELVVLWSQASLPEARAWRDLPHPKAQPKGRACLAEGGRPSRARGAQQTLHGSPVVKTALFDYMGHRFNPWSET